MSGVAVAGVDSTAAKLKKRMNLRAINGRTFRWMLYSGSVAEALVKGSIVFGAVGGDVG